MRQTHRRIYEEKQNKMDERNLSKLLKHNVLINNIITKTNIKI